MSNVCEKCGQQKNARGGCGVCAGKRVVEGINDFKSFHPELVSQWSPLNEKGPHEYTKGSAKSVLWVCEHGHEWSAPIKRRVAGHGCPVCSGRKVITGINDVESKSPELLLDWNSKLDPSTTYYQSRTSIMWKCHACGHNWKAVVRARANGNGCPACKNKAVNKGFNDIASQRPDLAKEWSPLNKKKASEAGVYSNNYFLWKCDKGHTWEEKPSMRSERGWGCPYCSNKRVLPGFNDFATTHPDIAKLWSDENSITPQEFTHGSVKMIKWKCDKGHIYQQTPNDKKRRTECPICSYNEFSSKGEKEMADFIEKVSSDTIKRNTREEIAPFELDVFIPGMNLAFEYNGCFWHSSAMKDKDYHKNKLDACHEKGIELIQIWEDDWMNKKEVVKKMISQKLQASQAKKVSARDCSIEEIPPEKAREFLENNHIQGYAKGVSVGLVLKNELVSLMTFRDFGDIEILRYASSCSVRGGFTKLLSYIKKKFPGRRITTFSNNEISQGNLYRQAGFHIEKELPPDYTYLVGYERKHKFGYRLSRFKNDPNLFYEEGLTEAQLAEANGFLRCYDSGKLKWALT